MEGLRRWSRFLRKKKSELVTFLSLSISRAELPWRSPEQQRLRRSAPKSMPSTATKFTVRNFGVKPL